MVCSFKANFKYTAQQSLTRKQCQRMTSDFQTTFSVVNAKLDTISTIFDYYIDSIYIKAYAEN